MEKLFTSLSRKHYFNYLAWVFFIVLLAASSQVHAQQSKITSINSLSSTPWITTTGGFSVKEDDSQTGAAYWENGTAPSLSTPFGTGVNSPDRVVNSNLNDFATAHVVLGGSTTLRVSDNPASYTYTAGNFAGFLINPSGVLNASLLGSITVRTYLNGGTAQETVTSSNLLSVSSSLVSGAYEVGFYTTKPYNQIEITFSGIAQTFDVYYAVLRAYQASATAPVCNTMTTLSQPTYPAIVEPNNTGFSGVNVATITNQDNAVSASKTDFASLNLLVSVGTASFAVKDQVTDYAAGSFAGFDISSPNLVNITALSSLTISTYLNGSPTTDSFTGTSLVSVGSAILGGVGRQTVGFVTTQPFDEVKLTVGGVNAVGTTSIYGAVIEPFCNGPSLVCTDTTIPSNTLTPLTNPTSPVYVDGKNTGIDAIACVGCSINNSQNVVDGTATTPATIVLTAGVATSASFAVANALDTYPAKSFAGFDIATNPVLSADVLSSSSATISLYNNGALVQTSTGNALLVGATTTILDGITGANRRYVGVVANVPYDEVKITFNQVVSANPAVSANLGTISIYRAIFEKTCSAVLVCNTAYNLSNPVFPVVIDNARTGVSGLVAAQTTVQDAWNVVSASTTDYAVISNTAAVGTNASIAVLNAIDSYPAGTFAGFSVQKTTGLLTADLFSRLTITTYKGGTLVESRSGTSLLDLSLILFGTTTDNYTVGFVTTQSFDEIQLTVAPLVGLSVLSGSLKVYGAFIDTRTSTGGGLVCALVTNPDFNVTNKNVTATGNVKTNDLVPGGTTYGPAPAPSSKPSGAPDPSLTVNADGTYSFLASVPGVYVYSVPVCGSGLSGTGCATQTLTVTVKDPTITTNPPVANPDVASLIGSPTTPTPVTINVKANDGPGNPGGTLGTPTIAVPPTNGTATVDGNGNVVYTPAAGFYGTDKLTYQVCETPGTSLCASATVTITVEAPGSANTTVAADDYISTYQGVAVSGNVKTNDSDPEGNTQTVTAQTTTIPGKGTLVVTSTGSYTFTPVAGATGPVDFSYTTTDNGSPAVSANGTLHVLVNPFTTNPDFAVTNKGVPVVSSVSTNDIVPIGATYGPTASLISQPTGSTATLSLTPTGSYTFTSSIPGVYVYTVPVCTPAPSPVCTTQTLTITVKDPTLTTNPPVANPDFATTTGAATNPTSVTVNVTANDGPGNQGGVLGTPTIGVPPANGTASIVNGMVVYTPAAGFYGIDKLTYQVCETPGTSLCASATVTITVEAPGSVNTTVAVDDYVSTNQGVAVSGNVKTNDSDPEGNTQTVAAQTTTVAGKGTLVLTASGSYTFTPAAGATGPVDFTYTTTDNGTPVASATGTLHVLINPFVANPITTNPDFAVTNINVPVAGNVKTNDTVPAGTTYGPAPAPSSKPSGAPDPSLTVNADGTYSFLASVPGVYIYSIPVCASGVSGTGCATQTLMVTVKDPTVNTNPPVVNADVASTVGDPTSPASVTVNVRANDGPGNAGGTLITPNISTPPTHGTAVVDGNGNVVYTPAAGYYGTDMLTYTVCETPGTSLCGSATVTITVKAPGTTNTTVASDDYISTYQGTPITGNVKTNDSDPEGNTQTVTAQTTTVPGKGTLVVTSAGSYTFTPVAGATGPVDFTYTTTDNGTPVASANGTLHVLVNPFNPNPDFSVTNKGVPTVGSVSTNDVVPVGSTYGPTVSLVSQPSGSTPTLTLSTTGSYTFTSSTPGVYVYSVPVCTPAPSPICTSQTLTITVLDPAVTNNPPVANPDFVTTTGDPMSTTPVTVNVRANDGPGNTGGTLGTPTIVVPPTNGVASIVNGNLVYTPTAGYFGTDMVTYQVCETGGTCATATVSITVKAPGAPANVSINDDYVATTAGMSATGNVTTNDVGTGLTVSVPGTTITSSGTLVITNTGSYTYTPATGITGPVTFTYTACDTSNPSVCGSATLHVLVEQGLPDLTPSQIFSNAQIGAGQTIDVLVAIRNVADSPTSGEVKFFVTNYTPTTSLTVVLNTDPTVTVGGTTYTLNTADFNVSSTDFAFTFTSVGGPNGVIAAKGSKLVAFRITRSADSTPGSVTNTVTIQSGTGGGETPVNNNTIANTFFKP